MTHEADNPMTGSDFDWMVSNHAVWGWKAPVKASVSGVSLLSSLPFSLPSFPFSPETPDTQAMYQFTFFFMFGICDEITVLPRESNDVVHVNLDCQAKTTAEFN